MDESGFRLFDLVGNNNVEWKPNQSASRTNNNSNNVNNSNATIRKRSSLDTAKSKLPVSKLSPEGNFNNLDSKYDCCAFVIHCPKHSTVAISKPTGVNASWLPFTPLPSNKSWHDGALAGSYIVLSGGKPELFLPLKECSPYCDVQCWQVLRHQMPQSLSFITRLVYYIKLDPAKASPRCCQNTSRIEWIPIKEILENKVKFIWGPEVGEFCRLINTSVVPKVSEYSLEEALTYVPRDPPRNLEETVLKSIKITEKDVERLYADFLDHCFPSFYQSFDSFKYYTEKYDFKEANETQLQRLFAAFNYTKTGYLSFHEFLIGMALMEPKCVHGELRARFIFRYYDINNDGLIGMDELIQLMTDINPTETQDVVAKRAAESMQQDFKTKQVNGQTNVSLSQFCISVGAHRFRGTSALCRAPKPIFPQISRAIANRTVKTGAKTSLCAVVYNRNYKGTCLSCKEVKYELAAHTVHINQAGYFSHARQVIDVTDNEKSNSIPKRSIELVYNPKYAANIMINLVRDFNLVKGTSRNPYGLMSAQPEQLFELIQELTQQILAILKTELKCKKIASPCFIIGDIHGNLEDLLSLEKALWRRIPTIGSNYLFLGDYVDRGRWSLECSLYLFAFKVLVPSNVTLLRGNHEVRDLQAHYTYKNECFEKYGRKWGEKIWATTNMVFDHLPVCAVVDNKVFCAHGGIPRSANIEDIVKVDQNVQDPQRESSTVWEILWSDPCHMQQFHDIAEINSNSTEDIEQGYIKNFRRGTAFLFNEQAARNFLSTNNLSHIIRAHEVPQPGYTFHFGSRCATIFSCSHYCGNNNDCACVLADNQTLRIIHLDTVNNSSATD